MEVSLSMIQYQSEYPTRNTEIGFRRIYISINPASIYTLVIFIISGMILVKILDESILEKLTWILSASSLLSLILIFYYYRTKAITGINKMKQNIKKNNLPEFQEDIFIKEKIIQNIYGKIIHYNYSEIKGIYFFSDVILVREKKGFIMYYARNSFTNATEEEWVQFMKSKNPKIKVRRFKSDYIWYF